MDPTALVLTPAQSAALRAAAARAYPQESCGLLIGTGDGTITLTEIVDTTNVAENPALRFEIDPQVQFDLLRRLRGTDRRVVGHYHSHPNGVASLSTHDLAMAHDPAAIWIVIPVAEGKAGAPRAFVCATRHEASPIPIIEGGG